MDLRNVLRQRSTIGFGLALIALVAIGITAVLTAIRYRESSLVVNRSYRVLAALKGTMADLVSAESEVRGFTITANEQFLPLYRTAVEDVKMGMTVLHANVIDPESLELLEKFDQLCLARLARLEVTLDKRKMEGFEAVRLATGPGKALMDELRAIAAGIETRQRQLLNERDVQAVQLSERTILVVIVGSSFAVLPLAISMVMLSMQLQNRDRLEREVLEISEREQRRIGQDLHDGLCQQLTGISLLSRGLRQKMPESSLSEDVAQITRLINETIDQTRQVTRGLLPVPDEPSGLMIALRELAESVKRSGPIDCKFSCSQPVPVPDRVAATNLYRIAQEAVQNSLRHSLGTKIQIKLSRDEESIYLSIADDGRGLPKERHSNGLGLEIMAYRARSIGGVLEAKRAEPRGTVVSCRLPLIALV